MLTSSKSKKESQPAKGGNKSFQIVFFDGRQVAPVSV